MGRLVLLFLFILAWSASMDPASDAHAAEAGFDARDYLAMDVCLDEHGAVIIGLTPADRKCVLRRNVRDGDRLPYHLVTFGKPLECGTRRLIRDNLIWSVGGVERAIGAVNIQRDVCDDKDPLIPSYYSVRWVDKQFAFIMGTWTRGTAGGRIGGGATPNCAVHPDTSARYFRNWVLFPTTEIADGSVGYGVFRKKGAFLGLARVGTPCPDDYPSRYLAIWSRGDFVYSTGLRLNTMLSHPYSQANEDGTSPGKSRQMERTYWTREFGQSRWENWKRDDFINKHVNKGPEELAEEFFANGRCSKPFEISGKITVGMTLGPVEDSNGIYSQVVTDSETGEQHRWTMVGCQDTTATVQPLSATGDAYPATEPVTPVFWEFWKE